MTNTANSRSRTILLVQFALDMPADDYLDHCWSVANAIGAHLGLDFKLWGLDPELGTATGVYVFNSADAAQRFIEGPIFAGLRSAPIRGLRTATYTLLAGPSRRTGAARLLDARTGEAREAVRA